MSVINKMLQDLEQRQPSLAADSARKKLPQPAAGSHSRFIWLILLVLLALLCAFWLSQSRQLLAEPATAVATLTSANTEPGQQPTAQQNNNNIAQQSTNAAAPTTIMAALAPANAAPDFQTSTDLAVTDSAEHAAAEVAASITAEPATPSLPVQTTQPDLPPAEVAAPQPVLVAAVPSQITVYKQPLSAAAQQHNMQLRANASEAAGDTSAAIVIWQQLVARQPAEPAGYLNLARLWLKQQQVVSASQVLLQARQNGVVSAEINMQLAQLAVRQGQWQQALEFLSDQFELATEPEYFGFKATVLQQLQQHEAALGWYQQLQQLQPEQGRWSLGAALASEQLGQSLQAHQYYQHAWQYRQALSVSSHSFIQQRLKATEP